MTAYDCGKKRAADDAEVEIQVKPTCKPSWQGEELHSDSSCELSFTLVSLLVHSDNNRASLGARGEIFGDRLAAVYPGCLPKNVRGHDKNRMDKRGCLPLLSLHYPLPFLYAGWNKRIEYAPGAGSLALFPGIRLETCDEPLWNIQATIELQTSHVAKGCDRDNYSERALRKLCGGCALPSPDLS